MCRPKLSEAERRMRDAWCVEMDTVSERTEKGARHVDRLVAECVCLVLYNMHLPNQSKGSNGCCHYQYPPTSLRKWRPDRQIRKIKFLGARTEIRWKLSCRQCLACRRLPPETGACLEIGCHYEAFIKIMMGFC